MVAMDNRGWIDQAWFAGHRSDFAITMADVERIMETVFPYGYVTGGIVTGVVTNKPVVIAHDDVTLSSCYVDTVYVASTVDATTLHIQGGRVGQVVYLQDGVSRGYDNLLSTYSTTFDPSAVGRSTNLRISMDAIDGYVLQPNAQFSMNSALGPRTAAQGYQNAYVFTSGGTEMGLAGGICQTTTTVFNAALLAGLQIDARYQHAQRVSYGQLGLDAAIYQTINDLKFTNPYNAPILLDTVYDASGVLTVNLYTIEPMELPEIHMEVVQNGYTFTATRYVDGVADYTTRSTY